MTDEERRAKGLARRLAFQNTANGVPPDQIRAALRMSELELDQAVRFVSKKITENRALRRQPTIACANLAEIRFNRTELLGVLSIIGDLDLSTDLILARVNVQMIDHPEMLDGARRRMEEAYK